jgi:hypothetical protein
MFANSSTRLLSRGNVPKGHPAFAYKHPPAAPITDNLRSYPLAERDSLLRQRRRLSEAALPRTQDNHRCGLLKVCFPPHRDRIADAVLCRLRAISGLMHCSKSHPYSMTSSARNRRASGIVRPIALAVLRLMTSSNLVGCSTGISAGFAPLRTRSTISAPRRHWPP